MIATLSGARLQWNVVPQRMFVPEEPTVPIHLVLFDIFQALSASPVVLVRAVDFHGYFHGASDFAWRLIWLMRDRSLRERELARP